MVSILFVTLILGVLCQLIGTWIYNLWFHPLASFPGPLLGRASLVRSLFLSSSPSSADNMISYPSYGDFGTLLLAGFICLLQICIKDMVQTKKRLLSEIG